MNQKQLHVEASESQRAGRKPDEAPAIRISTVARDALGRPPATNPPAPATNPPAAAAADAAQARPRVHPIPPCPHCGHEQCPVSKGAKEFPHVVVRMRRCRKCGTSFKTVASILPGTGGFVGAERVTKI